MSIAKYFCLGALAVTLTATVTAIHYKNEYETLHDQLVRAQELAKRDTDNLNSTIEYLKSNHATEKERYEATIDSLKRAIANRLHDNDQDLSSDPTVGVGETTTDTNGGIVNRLIDITAKGDKAIMDLNFCIDQYNLVREKQNGIISGEN